MECEIQFTREVIVPPPPRLPGREVGACVEFLGLVRETEGPERIAGLFYEAYESMARSEMRRILDEMAKRYPLFGAHFIHRLGWVPVGEASIFLRVLTSHRGPALAACGEAIDQMKKDVPIWKRAEGAGSSGLGAGDKRSDA